MVSRLRAPGGGTAGQLSNLPRTSNLLMPQALPLLPALPLFQVLPLVQVLPRSRSWSGTGLTVASRWFDR
ncbi:MAG: hypothetical protein ACRDRQ_02780 [Pseudonocardiaceae bacterium]